MTATPRTDRDSAARAASIERSPMYKEVLARIQTLVERGELSPGDRLPGERDLAVELGISRNSLRPALAALEALGVIEIRHGAGAFLRTPTIAKNLAVALVEQNRHLPAALEARMAVERFAAGLAAGRRDDTDLDRMKATLEGMDALIDSGENTAEADEAFHIVLVAASHNPVLVELHADLREPIARIRDESLAQPGRPRRSLEAHRRIAEAVEAEDPRAAIAAVDAHLSEVGEALLLRSAGTDTPGPEPADGAD